MTTTLMRDSTVGDDWIRQVCQQVPIQRVKTADGSAYTQDILTGPVRLSWDYLFDLPPVTKDNQNPKYGATLLFPPEPLVNFGPMYEDYWKIMSASFADCYDQGTQQYYGVRSPFRQQSEKLKFSGYTPGAVFITCSTKFQPSVVDARGNPIVDKKKAYAGVWAICSINAYANTDARTKGPRFGLQNVMIIGDDKPLSGGGADPSQTFKGVNVTASPIVRPDSAALLGQMARPGGAPPPVSGAPGIPQSHYAPPPPVPGTPAPHVQETEDERMMREMMS